MVSYAMCSRTGGRQKNEDSVRMCEWQGNYVFVLADGLGGHGMGECASACVTRQAVRALKMDWRGENYLEYAFSSAQECLMQEKSSAGIFAEMKTTMVALHLTLKTAQWCHVGDSRLYHFQENRVERRTLDHSVPQMLVMNGELKEKQIRHHSERNKVLRVMGTPWEQKMYELEEPILLEGGDAFLLCTDGFWEWIVERDMEKCLKKAKSAATWLAAMEKIVLKNGQGANMDNYSAICVFV